MAHFAEIDESGIVLRVVVVDNENCPDPAPERSEPLGIAYLESIGLGGNWVQTSYNHAFRKQYAGIGDRYDAEADVFISPQPFPSWTLDENYDWQPPVLKPDGNFAWDEESGEWVSIDAELLPPVSE